MRHMHADRIGWRKFGSGCILAGGMCLKNGNSEFDLREENGGDPTTEPA